MAGFITVLDAVTHNPISGATIFVNSVGQQGVTNPAGQYIVSSAANYNLSIKASNYSPYPDTGVPAGTSFTAFLQPLAAPNLVSLNLNILPEATANGNAITFTGGITPVQVNYTFGGLAIQLNSGPQTITGSIKGFVPINDSVDTSQTTAKIIQLVAIEDTSLKQPLTQPVAVVTSSDQLLPVLSKQSLPEFIPPNSGQGTYFTMTQARMYIGDIFIDELNFCQFVLQNNKIPIYGYASRDFDDIAQGKSLVQGQFGINFISEGYLYTTLLEYDKLSGSGNVVDATTKVQQQNQVVLLDLVNKLQNPDPAWTHIMLANASSQVRTIVAGLGSQGPAALQAARAGINTAVKQQQNSILGLPGGDYVNATYNDVEFDIVLQYTGAGRTITRRLERCHLISNESIMDHSGTPIIDSYGFIARRLR